MPLDAGRTPLAAVSIPTFNLKAMAREFEALKQVFVLTDRGFWGILMVTPGSNKFRCTT